MKKNAILKKVLSGAAVVTLAAAAVPSSAGADWVQVSRMGDLNGDGEITTSDLVILGKHLLGTAPMTYENTLDVSGKYYSINGSEAKNDLEYLQTADLNQDGVIDIYDYVQLRINLVNYKEPWGEPVYIYEEDTVISTTPMVTTTTTTSAETTTSYETTTTTTGYEETSTSTTFAVKTTTSTTEAATTTTTASDKFIAAPIKDLYGSLPSQGEADLCIFYVDFPDCKYAYEPSMSEVEKCAFGPENTSDSNYPFDSMSAFYSRSSKGTMNLTGKAYRYTTKKNKATYENDAWHVELIKEVMAAFDDQIDFGSFDADKDGVIDSVLINVPILADPENATTTNWWPAAGQYYDSVTYQDIVVDNTTLGHVIVGNAAIVSATDHSNFVSTYLHEMGHCMGLPDYYLYGVDDFEGMHGSAGFELMDDAICDFGALSKIMLGWYKENQIQVYDSSKGEQTFTLTDSETDEGNCIIIPNGKWNGNYCSEYFVVEYTSLAGNNTDVKSRWWMSTGSGVRVFHAEATVINDWSNTFKYSSGNDEYTNNNQGRRFIRLINEGNDNTDNLYKAGDTIASAAVSGFKWYDSNGGQTIDPGITIKVGELSGDSYTVTISG